MSKPMTLSEKLNRWADAADDECRVDEADLFREADAEIARLEDELTDAQNVPWPAWAETILKTMKRYGYDPVVDGEVDLGEAFKDYLEGVDQEDKSQRSALAAKDAEIEAQAVVIEKYREAQQAEWHPISTCPVRDSVDLWCVYGGEEFAQFEGGSPIGFLVSNRFKTEEYGFFGNQSKDGVPRRDGPDFVPVAWRHAVPSCPPALIAEALGIPLTLEDALAGDKADA